jgi:GNAT superfamily N-acetyltransferase
MTVDSDDVTIRPATATDAENIAQVHVSSWRSAYADLLPAEYLASMDGAAHTERWQTVISAGAASTGGGRVLVAEQAEQTVGFASFGPSSDEDADDDTVELYAMYLVPGAWGHGVARELMRGVLTDLDGAPMTLWVLAGNERAQHFYQRHGFRPDGVERIDDSGDTPVTVLRFRRPAI